MCIRDSLSAAVRAGQGFERLVCRGPQIDVRHLTLGVHPRIGATGDAQPRRIRLVQ